MPSLKQIIKNLDKEIRKSNKLDLDLNEKKYIANLIDNDDVNLANELSERLVYTREGDIALRITNIEIGEYETITAEEFINICYRDLGITTFSVGGKVADINTLKKAATGKKIVLRLINEIKPEAPNRVLDVSKFQELLRKSEEVLKNAQLEDPNVIGGRRSPSSSRLHLLDPKKGGYIGKAVLPPENEPPRAGRRGAV